MTKTFEYDGSTYVVLKTKEEADEHVTDEDISDALDWFADKRGVPTEDFMDRLCGNRYDGRPGIEVEDFGDPAAKRLLSRARKLKREMDDYNA
jgi:hypothetical protein